jgi:hypothetical protein
MGLAVGPFGVVDAIAAIREAEHHENAVKENRAKLAKGWKWQLGDDGLHHPAINPWAAADPTDRAFGPRPRYPVEAESFTNCIKCCLSRIGDDPHRRAEFLKEVRSVLDAMAAEPANTPALIDGANDLIADTQS